MASPGDIPPSLEADFAALRKLRDESECDELKQAWSAEDPTKWTITDEDGNQQPCVIAEDGRVVALGLKFSSLAVLPDAIGELEALKQLFFAECTSLVKLSPAIGKLGALKLIILDGCKSLAALPDEIGELGALQELNLSGCTSLAMLPDAIVGREDLEIERPQQLPPGPLGEDFAALRRLRNDDSSGALKEYFGDDEDPREWKGKNTQGCEIKSVTVADGRVTELKLYECSKLVTLPAAIGELGALTELDLRGCSSLAKLPEGIVGREGLTLELPAQLVTGPLGEDFAALRNMRRDDVNGALKEYFGDGEDPREWTYEVYGRKEKCVAVNDGRVTKLALYKCSSLTALPNAIGGLGALTYLELAGCSSLAELPAAIGELGALTELGLSDCEKLEQLPEGIVRRVKNVKLPWHLMNLDDMPASLREALTTLRELRDDSALREYLGDEEDPREWKYEVRYGQAKCVTVKDGRVIELSLCKCTKLTDLPAAIGELGDLTELDLRHCSSLVKLPTTIGKLGALRTLKLRCCANLAALPEEIGDLGVLKIIDLSNTGITMLPEAISSRLSGRTTVILGSLDQDFANLERASEESGALQEHRNYWRKPIVPEVSVVDERVTALKLGKIHPVREATSIEKLPDAICELTSLRELGLKLCLNLFKLSPRIRELRALTTLDLSYCSKLAVLPDEIGELDSLMELDLSGCSSLEALPHTIGGLTSLKELLLYKCSKLSGLPVAIGGLEALTVLTLADCTSLTFPHKDLRYEYGNEYKESKVKPLLANMSSLLDGALAWADADNDVKTGFLESIITNASYAGRLEVAVCKDPTLVDVKNVEGESAIAAAHPKCRRAMQKALMFLGRYEIADGPPEHRSATSLVVRAVDAATDYGKLFDEFDKNDSGMLDTDELEALAANLGTSVDTFKLADGESYTRDAFVARFGKERKVVIKIFQKEEQWRNEKKARDDQQLDAQFVVQTIEAQDDDEFDDKFKDALKESKLFTEPRFGGSVGSHAIVMDAADRNLLQIYQSERPDLNTVRSLMKQVMECVQHLHEKGIVHGDIKMLNVVRLSLDNKLRLIDLDAATKIGMFGEGDTSYVGSKFSSAVLPPECFAKLDADQVAQFENYFKGDDAERWEKASPGDSELWEKVAPKVDNRGASYVVKTFSLDEDGTPKDGLPYELVEASVAVDYWSLGALLFQLVANKPLVPSNRDDDCVDGNAMKALASWDETSGEGRQCLAQIKDPAARDLASKLLIADPLEREKFDIKSELSIHPFLNPKDDVAMRKKLDKIIEQQKKDSKKLDTIKADTSAILKLSKENKFELERTREVLLKAVFEATEVTTPTTFVVLSKELTDDPELTEEQQEWIKNHVRDDGSGVVVKGDLPPWYAEVRAKYDDKQWAEQLAKFDKSEGVFSKKQKAWIAANVEFQDDGSGVLVKGKLPEWYADVEARFKDGMDWAEQLASFTPKEVLTPDNFASAIKTAFKKLLPTQTLYFYLVDELTGEPIKGPGYPIPITKPDVTVSKLLPVMQVGMHAMSAYQGVAGVARMFGYPLPLVPEKWRDAAKDSVDLLKQKSSVAAFGAIDKKVNDKDEVNQTVRGASLRELERFFKDKDKDKLYAGLRRVGDPNDGTAVWTRLEGDKFEDALSERAKQWEAEHDSSEKRSLDTKGAALGEVAPRSGLQATSTITGSGPMAAPALTPLAAQGQNADAQGASANTLARSNVSTSGTCNNMTCYCAIA